MAVGLGIDTPDLFSMRSFLANTLKNYPLASIRGSLARGIVNRVAVIGYPREPLRMVLEFIMFIIHETCAKLKG
jgi:hypothetical protein